MSENPFPTAITGKDGMTIMQGGPSKMDLLRLPPEGLKIHDPSPEDLDIVREAALRMGRSQFISDVTISLLLTEMADRYDSMIDSGAPHSPTMHSVAAGNITGWKYAVALSYHLTGRS